MARTSRKQRENTFKEYSNNYQTGIYLRLSDKDIGKNVSESIKNQQELLLDFIDKNPELILRKVFVDDGKSGVNFNRPGFNELMEEVKSGKINCIVVKDLSRFGRNYLETGNYIENVFQFLGIRFIAVTDNFDTLTSGQAELTYLFPIKNMMNESYARDISIKEKSAKAILRKKGCFLGAHAPYGYVKSKENKHKLIVDLEAANVVKMIFDMVEEGNSDIAIAKYLNEKNIPCPAKYKFDKGYDIKNYSEKQYWYKQTILRITTNEIYIGNMVQGTRVIEEIRGKSKAISKDKWDIVEDIHEAIISKEQYKRVENIRKIKKDKYLKIVNNPITNESNINLFKGLILCGDCKKAMLRSKVKNCSDIYRFKCSTFEDAGGCSRKYIREGHLIDLISSVINERIKLSHEINKKLDKLTDNTIINDFNKKFNEIQTKQRQVEKLKMSLHKDLKEGILDKSEYVYIKNKYETDILNYQKNIEEISSSKIQYMERYTAENNAIKKAIQYKDEIILTGELLKAMIERIEIYDKDKIKLVFKFQDDFNSIVEYIKGLEVDEDAE